MEDTGLNIDKVCDALGVSREDFLNIARRTFSAARVDIIELEKAFLSGDRDVVKKVTHRFKGTFSTLGVEKMRQMAIEIEKCAFSDAVLETVRGTLEMFKSSFKALEEDLEQKSV